MSYLGELGVALIKVKKMKIMNPGATEVLVGCSTLEGISRGVILKT